MTYTQFFELRRGDRVRVLDAPAQHVHAYIVLATEVADRAGYKYSVDWPSCIVIAHTARFRADSPLLGPDKPYMLILTLGNGWVIGQRVLKVSDPQLLEAVR